SSWPTTSATTPNRITWRQRTTLPPGTSGTTSIRPYYKPGWSRRRCPATWRRRCRSPSGFTSRPRRRTGRGGWKNRSCNISVQLGGSVCGGRVGLPLFRWLLSKNAHRRQHFFLVLVGELFDVVLRAGRAGTVSDITTVEDRCRGVLLGLAAGDRN